jgi:hypothetical protein
MIAEVIHFVAMLVEYFLEAKKTKLWNIWLKFDNEFQANLIAVTLCVQPALKEN